MTLAEAFEAFRSRLELDPAYSGIVQQRHSAIRSYVERSIPWARTQLIGSLQRRTRIDPLTGLSGFDIDILVELGAFTAWAMGRGITCDDALNTLENAIRGNLLYRRMGPYEDQPAIIIPYSDDSSVELVPAYQDMIPDHSPSGRAYWVPRLNQWKLADYDVDAGYISATNQACGGRLVPTIKMLKAWRRHVLPELRSYHLEVLAAAVIPTVIRFWQSKGRALTWPLLIHGFLVCAEDKVREPVRIPGSLSEPADYYLSSQERQRIADKIKTCADFAQATFGQSDWKAIEMWRRLFGKPFPGG